MASTNNRKTVSKTNRMTASLAWRQFKGDPAIRNNLFEQQRIVSPIDEHIDTVINVISDALCERGFFHTQLHFSSSWVTMWHSDDPYNFQLHGLDELIHPEFSHNYPIQPYHHRAQTSPQQITAALKLFKVLRYLDDNIYLRAASINIINGIVGLTFSCDGSHYMPVEEFLAKDIRFWLGKQVMMRKTPPRCINDI